ncbi:MAG: hypothetical protein D6726_01640 [Nitrospirae bacterium]|nr:MAG: hypothetical protein D6726_01640 [Nitrospirota bacterium]
MIGLKIKRWITVGIITLLFLLMSGTSYTGEERVVIGVVFSSDNPYYEEIHRSFINTLKERGDIEKINFLVQRPNPDPVAWSNAIRKLIVYDASILITYGAGATEAARYEVDRQKVFYAGVLSPDDTLKKPPYKGGVGSTVPISSILRYLKKTGDVKRVGVMFYPEERTSIKEAKELKAYAERMKLSAVLLPVHSRMEIGQKIRLFDIDALYITGSSFLEKNIVYVDDLLKKKDIPIVTSQGGLEKRAVISLYTDPEIVGRMLASIISEPDSPGSADRFVSARKTRLVFNKSLCLKHNLEIPLELLTGADEVIR